MRSRGPYVLTPRDTIVQSFIIDAPAFELTLQILVAINTEIGRIGKVGAELDKERSEVFIQAVEIVYASSLTNSIWGNCARIFSQSVQAAQPSAWGDRGCRSVPPKVVSIIRYKEKRAPEQPKGYLRRLFNLGRGPNWQGSVR